MTTYAYKDFDAHTVKAYGSNLSISTKSSINICNKIRGMDVQKAIAFLVRVQKKQEPVPFTRFTDGVGHKPGMAAGRYPINAAKEISALLASAVANAANQGFGEELKIVHICAHKAATPMHQGRQRRRVMKRTHIEVVLKEAEGAKRPAKKTAKSSASELKKEGETVSNTVAKKETMSSTVKTTEAKNIPKQTIESTNPDKEAKEE